MTGLLRKCGDCLHFRYLDKDETGVCLLEFEELYAGADVATAEEFLDSVEQILRGDLCTPNCGNWRDWRD